MAAERGGFRGGSKMVVRVLFLLFHCCCEGRVEREDPSLFDAESVSKHLRASSGAVFFRLVM
eukprot:226195-Prymnesium_polylepis.1